MLISRTSKTIVLTSLAIISASACTGMDTAPPIEFKSDLREFKTSPKSGIYDVEVRRLAADGFRYTKTTQKVDPIEITPDTASTWAQNYLPGLTENLIISVAANARTNQCSIHEMDYTADDRLTALANCRLGNYDVLKDAIYNIKTSQDEIKINVILTDEFKTERLDLTAKPRKT